MDTKSIDMKKSRKGKITYKILEALLDMSLTAIDLFDVIASTPYGASYGRLEYEMTKRRRSREKAQVEAAKRQRARNILYKLKQDGLIVEEKRGKRRIFTITSQGKRKWKYFKGMFQNALPPTQYPQIPRPTFTIVAFDIPESEKRKRDWLRAVLRYLGFRMIQKSVWIGKIKVPESLIHDLSELKILECVEIFEITKTGSLTHIA